MSQNLKDLLQDLAHYPAKLAAYMADPESVMTAYNLTDAQKEILYSGDEDAIAEAIGDGGFVFKGIIVAPRPKPPKSEPLVRLLKDLTHYPELLVAYQADPESVMNEYGLAQEEKDALYSGDEDEIERLSGGGFHLFKGIIVAPAPPPK